MYFLLSNRVAGAKIMSATNNSGEPANILAALTEDFP